jgi:hypothetical protein
VEKDLRRRSQQELEPEEEELYRIFTKPALETTKVIAKP